MLIVFEIVTDPKAQKLWGYYAGVGLLGYTVGIIQSFEQIFKL